MKRNSLGQPYLNQIMKQAVVIIYHPPTMGVDDARALQQQVQSDFEAGRPLMVPDGCKVFIQNL